jgi:hypothetical protein
VDSVLSIDVTLQIYFTVGGVQGRELGPAGRFARA